MESIGFLAATVALGVAAQKVVEFVRTFIALNSNWTRLVALIVGTALAYAFDLDPAAAISTSVGVPLRDLPEFVDWIVGGVFIGSAAGYLADRAGRSNATVVVSPAPTTVINNPVIDPDV
jgi:hypothetical protein